LNWKFEGQGFLIKNKTGFYQEGAFERLNSSDDSLSPEGLYMSDGLSEGDNFDY